ncbi:MAG TPA: NAD(P)/FAD-dependent oxidoreductase [Fimbriimonadaceae bacterium]|nr:NAD(P)/FAD-dependent oxidoreductase [Fimbriimonadaceae bacterium]
MPRVVIVGGGFGGLEVAKGLRRAPADVLLLDRSNHHLFQPLLYQVATAALSPADIAAPVRSVLRRQRNTQVLMAEVHDVDLAGGRVLLAGGASLEYDHLVLATGSMTSYFGHDEWERLAPGLKTIDDATRIRRNVLLAFERAECADGAEQMRRLLTFVIVGGGPTGVEMAGSIAELAHQALRRDFRRINPQSARIILIEASPSILGGFEPSLARHARRDLIRLGVEVLEGVMVEDLTDEGVSTSQGFLASQNVIWAAGVRATPVARWLQVQPDRMGRVPVEPDLTVASHPKVFVIGDAALLAGPGGRPLPGVSPVAMQQGRYVAKVILRRLTGEGSLPPFRYRDKGMLATIGRGRAIAQMGRFRFAGLFAWLVWVFVHILYLVEFRARLIVLTQWAWAYLTWQRGARLITGLPEEQTRTLQQPAPGSSSESESSPLETQRKTPS